MGTKSILSASLLLLLISCSSPPVRVRKPTIMTGLEAEKYDVHFYSLSDIRFAGNPKTLETELKKIQAEKPEFVLFSGDILDGAKAQERDLARVKAELDKLGVLWLAVPGDSDVNGFAKWAWNQTFAGHGPSKKTSYWKQDIPDKFVTVVGLDTSVESSKIGRVDPDQLAWLDKTLGAIDSMSPERAVIVVMHHPLIVFNLITQRTPGLEDLTLANADQVRAVLFKHYSVKLVVSGHIRAPEYNVVDGIHYVSTPAFGEWPNLYTRLHLTSERISFDDLQIEDQSIAERSHRELLNKNGFWMKAFNGDAAAVDVYFAHGMTKADFGL